MSNRSRERSHEDSSHPSGLDDSCLVGDGGRDYLRRQQRHIRSTNEPKPSQSRSDTASQPTNERMQTRQERNRAKRAKKKQRKQDYKVDHSSQSSRAHSHSHSQSRPNSRSDFLYNRPSHPHPHPSPKSTHKDKDTSPVAPAYEAVSTTKDECHNPNATPPTQTDKKECITGLYRSFMDNQEDLNAVSAQLIKARLSGNPHLIAKLEQQMDDLRSTATPVHLTKRLEPSQRQSRHQRSHRDERRDENKIRQSPDAEPARRENNGSNVSLITDAKVAKQLHNMDETRAINDDDDIATLLKKERNRDTDAYQWEIIGGKKHTRMLGMDTDDQFDTMNEDALYGDGRKSTRKRKREKAMSNEDITAAEKARKRQRLVTQHRRNEKILENCHYCLENEIAKRQRSHLVVSMGKYLYLCLPAEKPTLHNYAALIVPHEHIACFRSSLHDLSEHYTREEQNAFEMELLSYRKSLERLCRKKLDCGVLFMETVKNLRSPKLRKRYHAQIEVIPVSNDDGRFSVAPTYFRKAILESDVMWSTNEKLTLIPKEKTIQSCIPLNMPYFHVQFGLDNGFAHVIEDETQFKFDFGRKVVAGIVEEILFKPHIEPYPQQMKRVAEFKQLYHKYDPMTKKEDNADVADSATSTANVDENECTEPTQQKTIDSTAIPA